MKKFNKYGANHKNIDLEAFKQKWISQVQSNGFNDIVHPDGSKSYDVVGFGHIKIERPSVVQIIEDILKCGYTGYGYVPAVDEHLSKGNISQEEYGKILHILD
jgi:hypothetical protein